MMSFQEKIYVEQENHLNNYIKIIWQHELAIDIVYKFLGKISTKKQYLWL